MNYTQIPLNIANGRIVWNSLYEPGGPSDVDLVYIQLDDGRCIDVDWSPPREPSGKYIVRLVDEDFEHVYHVRETRDVREAARLIEELSRL